MRRRYFVAIFSGIAIAMNLLDGFAADFERFTKLKYPDAPQDKIVDDYHGTKVPDIYRPLEDPDSTVTRTWVEAENKISFGFLEAIPARKKLRDRLTELWNFERFSVPFREGSRYFYLRNSGLQNQSVLYSATSIDGTPEVLIDPN